MKPAAPLADLARVVKSALAEDLGEAGDVTTDAVVPVDSRMKAVIRSREPPSGVDGGRNAPMRTPRWRACSTASRVSCGPGIRTDITAPTGASTPQACARRAALARTRSGRAGCSRSTPSAARAAPAEAGASPVS